MVSKVLGTGIAIALVAVAILAVPAVRHLREAPPASPPAIRLSLAGPPGTELGSADELLDAAISPDERQIVFVATTSGAARLWRRAFDAERADPIAGTDGAQLPAWKSTGNVISFFAGDRLKQVSLVDGAIRDLAPAAVAFGASWLPDGSLLFAADPRGVIRRLQNGAASDATTRKPGDRSHAFPMALGTGDAFVYTVTREDGGRVVRLVEGSNERDITTTASHGQLVGDTLLYVRDGVLLGQRLDPETRQPSGRALPLALDVATSPSGHGAFIASRRVLASAPRVTRLAQLTWFLLATGHAMTMREPGDYWQVRLSPDDQYAAITQLTPLVRTLDVVLLPLSDAGYGEPLTRAVAADTDPVWAPDGRSLVFRSLQDGPPRLYTHPAHDQDAADAIVPMSMADETPTDWHADRMIMHAPGAKGDLDVWTVAVSSGAREAVVSTGFNQTDARLSTGGGWIAYVSDESGQADIYAAPWPRGARVRVSFAGGTKPRWSRDGRSLLFLRGTQIMRAEFSSSSFTTPRPVLDVPGVRDFDVAHRSDRLIALVPNASTPAQPTASVLVDWGSALAAPR